MENSYRGPTMMISLCALHMLFNPHNNLYSHFNGEETEPQNA